LRALRVLRDHRDLRVIRAPKVQLGLRVLPGWLDLQDLQDLRVLSGQLARRARLGELGGQDHPGLPETFRNSEENY